jgi:hypothetical protein
VALTDQVSNELSLSQLPDGRYALIFQQSGIGKYICMQLGKTPYGPFGKVIKLWDTSEAIELKSFFTYNAKAHPGLSEKGELLISYNVNSFDFLKICKVTQIFIDRGLSGLSLRGCKIGDRNG